MSKSDIETVNYPVILFLSAIGLEISRVVIAVTHIHSHVGESSVILEPDTVRKLN